jgi:DNA-binding NarL/FixJ family response regulator
MSPSEHRTAVLLDRHPLWLEAVEQVLHRIGVEVTGKATSPEHALALIEEHGPSLFVTGIEMGDESIDGIECLALARERGPELKVIVLSAHTDAQYVDAALAAGADAYVVKTAHADDLASAIRQAFDHSIYLARAHGAKRQRPREAVEQSWGLTRRELEILTLVAEGHSNAQLARMLWVTEQTVKFHLSNIYRKLDVSNRTEASRWAQVHGLLPLQAASPQTTAA